MNKVINTQNPELLSQNLKYSQPPTPNSKLKICVVGTRGFPNVQGGVEAHCENLYPRLVKNGCEVVVFTRRPYVNLSVDDYQGVKLIPLECPKNKFLEAFLHTFKGIFAAKKIRPDILHIHAIGPALFTPLAKLLGMKVVFTHHGPDYRRKKWNRFAKFILKLGEFLGVRFADAVICIGRNITEELKRKNPFKEKKIFFIPNGIEISKEIGRQIEDEILKRYGLEKGKYILSVGRFVPEKGFDVLVSAFNQISSNPDFQNLSYKLVIVGDADHPDNYSKALKEKAKKNKYIVLTGFLPQNLLKILYLNAGLFVLPSYYEGLPITLLEALSFGLSCIVSDIPAHRELNLEEKRYFKPGNVTELREKLIYFLTHPLTSTQKAAQIQKISKIYNWDKICEKTLRVYGEVNLSVV